MEASVGLPYKRKLFKNKMLRFKGTFIMKGPLGWEEPAYTSGQQHNPGQNAVHFSLSLDLNWETNWLWITALALSLRTATSLCYKASLSGTRRHLAGLYISCWHCRRQPADSINTVKYESRHTVKTQPHHRAHVGHKGWEPRNSINGILSLKNRTTRITHTPHGSITHLSCDKQALPRLTTIFTQPQVCFTYPELLLQHLRVQCPEEMNQSSGRHHYVYKTPSLIRNVEAKTTER